MLHYTFCPPTFLGGRQGLAKWGVSQKIIVGGGPQRGTSRVKSKCSSIGCVHMETHSLQELGEKEDGVQQALWNPIPRRGHRGGI